MGWGTGCDRREDVQGAPAGSVPTGALPVSTVGRGCARGPGGTDMFWLHLCVLLTKHGRAACHLAVTLPLLVLPTFLSDGWF